MAWPIPWPLYLFQPFFPHYSSFKLYMRRFQCKTVKRSENVNVIWNVFSLIFLIFSCWSRSSRTPRSRGGYKTQSWKLYQLLFLLHICFESKSNFWTLTLSWNQTNFWLWGQVSEFEKDCIIICFLMDCRESWWNSDIMIKKRLMSLRTWIKVEQD